jgi:hypothetical protein
MAMTRRGPLAALALCCLAAGALAQTKGGDSPKGGAAETVAGLVCVAVAGMACLAAVGGAVFGLVWLIRRKQAQARRRYEGGFEGGVRGAAASGIDEAFARHRRAKQGRPRQDPELPG